MIVVYFRIPLPAMFVDLDVFDQNIKHLVAIAKPSGKTIRIATKSVRCPELIQRILDKGEGVIKGLMCYSVKEANLLATKYGLDDFYVAYPTVQYADIDCAMDMTQKGKWVCLTVDSVEHVCIMEKRYNELLKDKSISNPKLLRLAIDLDMSFTFGPIHLGAHRSKVSTVKDVAAIVEAIRSRQTFKLSGMMGYEAHVAGLPDNNPYSSLPNFLIRFLKPIFFNRAKSFRKDVATYCLQNSIGLEFFNGAGSGNLREACEHDEALSEVTAGSAFLQAQLLDYYVENQCSAAFCFALQATRITEDNICCQGGGFIASGSRSLDKCPVPFANPLKLVHFNDEGYGEVQTPLWVKGQTGIPGSISMGDPVFFRPAKSGEIGEHFDEYYLKRGYNIIGKAKTYRGLGCVFY